jgi:anti-sigma factor RsiW
VTHDDQQLVAFLNGQLPDAEEQVFDEHLLDCEVCWQAVQEDRAGRLVLERLRVSAPAGLADRVAASVALAGKSPAAGVRGTGRGRRLRRLRDTGEPERPPWSKRLVAGLAAAVLVLVAVGGIVGWTLGDRPAGDPPQIAGVVAMMPPATAGSAALRSGERLDLGGQELTVRAYRVHGVVTLVATSSRPFPMAASSHLLSGSSPTAWMATRGSLAMYGVNRPAGAGRGSMFLVAAMPMAQLPQVAARLHLI